MSSNRAPPRRLAVAAFEAAFSVLQVRARPPGDASSRDLLDRASRRSPEPAANCAPRRPATRLLRRQAAAIPRSPHILRSGATAPFIDRRPLDRVRLASARPGCPLPSGRRSCGPTGEQVPGKSSGPFRRPGRRRRATGRPARGRAPPPRRWERGRRSRLFSAITEAEGTLPGTRVEARPGRALPNPSTGGRDPFPALKRRLLARGARRPVTTCGVRVPGWRGRRPRSLPSEDDPRGAHPSASGASLAGGCDHHGLLPGFDRRRLATFGARRHHLRHPSRASGVGGVRVPGRRWGSRLHRDSGSPGTLARAVARTKSAKILRREVLGERPSADSLPPSAMARRLALPPMDRNPLARTSFPVVDALSSAGARDTARFVGTGGHTSRPVEATSFSAPRGRSRALSLPMSTSPSRRPRPGGRARMPDGTPRSSGRDEDARTPHSGAALSIRERAVGAIVSDALYSRPRSRVSLLIRRRWLASCGPGPLVPPEYCVTIVSGRPPSPPTSWKA